MVWLTIDAEAGGFSDGKPAVVIILAQDAVTVIEAAGIVTAAEKSGGFKGYRPATCM